MPGFDYIDLKNYVTYGNDFDEEWEEIRNIIKTDPEARRVYEEMKKGRQPEARRQESRPAPLSVENGSNGNHEEAGHQAKKKWWQI